LVLVLELGAVLELAVLESPKQLQQQELRSQFGTLVKPSQRLKGRRG
jgi:hypothetical protein